MEAAGGRVTDTQLMPLRYNTKDSLLTRISRVRWPYRKLVPLIYPNVQSLANGWRPALIGACCLACSVAAPGQCEAIRTRAVRRRRWTTCCNTRTGQEKSFLDLDDDLEQAVSEGKGIIVYFEAGGVARMQDADESISRPDIVNYTRQNFDVIAVSTSGAGRSTTHLPVIDQPARILAAALQPPSLVFYDPQAEIALRLHG